MKTFEGKLNHNLVDNVKLIQTVKENVGQVTLQFLILCLKIIVRNNCYIRLILIHSLQGQDSFARQYVYVMVITNYIISTWETFLERN